MKKVAYYTLGCKLNFSETSTMGRMFAEKGYSKVNFDEKADVYVINTCSVTDTADKKCRYIINKAVKTAPEATIIVNGCYAQLKGDEIAKIPGVDLVLGAENKFDFFEFLDKKHGKTDKTQLHACEIDEVKKYHSAFSLNDRTRSFLKVQDGCDYVCTYCTIPLARGKSRSNSIASSVNEAKQIAEKGFKEIVLTGVNIGDFGYGTPENFFQLIQ
jgi:threonylcarbamoyladenosine tRNA methylthiotransferase MtaB